ncbi:hypothetical protein [Arsenophonus sp. PmNCSU2021_1]|uniref:hypothetical protein n=1 Tax=Arsenophonus sp. PmNCSU2021_1 TaxID=3118989 RepID=UPI002FEE6795
MDGNCIGVNKVVSEWQSLPEKGNAQNRENLPEKGKKSFPKKGNTQKGETFPETGKKTFPKMGNSSSPKQGNTKDTITKDKKDNLYKPPIVPLAAKSKSFDPSSVELPAWLPKPTWDSWVQYRKEINKPIKSQQTVIQAIKLLGKCRDNGHQPEEIINASIANGWQGLFEPQHPARTQQAKTHSVADSFADKDYGEPQLPDWARECLSREGL